MAQKSAAGTACEPQIWLNSVNRKNKAGLIEWMKSSNISLVQENGQRKYGGPPPGWVGEAPPHGSEIFIGSIPQEIYEDTLIPLFQSVGRLYEFRLMMTFSGLNRGFAYARYSSKRVADQAITHLCNHEIQPGFKIFVCRSTEKCELMLDGLPLLMEQAALEDFLAKMTAGVATASLYASPFTKLKNMAVVKYNSHREAALAKKSLCEGTQAVYGCFYTVDWLQQSIRLKMQSDTLARPNPLLPLISNKQVMLEKLAPTATQGLQLLCEKLMFGQPVYQIKFLRNGNCGWLRFWYWVLIPNHGVPFTGYSWLVGDKLIPTEKYQQAKEMVASLIMKEFARCLGNRPPLLSTL
ncbi:dead end protein homolog 1 isoform X1 [Dendrobates tinctorius]|uniref:dead end protein homolog 1 isoform X1 n=2 Tax=Dendrobates tinctorius TaxID=92724 RepID=UPI003CC99928